MMRSMYSGVSGLRVHQTKMDVISNNIANINTVGFKRSSVSFKDSFSQTLSSASAANQDRGGINPQQIGMGANVGSIVNIMGQGAAQRTDYGSDLMIDGDGFFIVQDATGFSFTRAGVFEVDARGNLVDPNGLKVCGWKATVGDEPGTQKIVQDRVTPINLYEGDNLYSPAERTKNIEFSGNFNQTTNKSQKNTISFYDSQGNKYTINMQFDKSEGAPNEWAMSLPVVTGGAADGMVEVTVNGTEKMYLDPADLGITGAAADGKVPLDNNIYFTDKGTISNIGNAGADPDGPKNITLEPINLSNLQVLKGDPPALEAANFTNENLDAANGGGLNIDFKTVTQFNSKVTLTSETKDGNAAGNMTGFNIDANGIIRGTYSNGKTKILAQIPLANFKNPAGLEKVGSNRYRETGNSSEFDGIGQEASALGSTLQGGALEMSNVDLSYEFSEMITTQRGFQANSRIITTSDEMIQDLVNLKR